MDDHETGQLKAQFYDKLVEREKAIARANQLAKEMNELAVKIGGDLIVK